MIRKLSLKVCLYFNKCCTCSEWFPIQFNCRHCGLYELCISTGITDIRASFSESPEGKHLTLLSETRYSIIQYSRFSSTILHV